MTGGAVSEASPARPHVTTAPGAPSLTGIRTSREYSRAARAGELWHGWRGRGRNGKHFPRPCARKSPQTLETEDADRGKPSPRKRRGRPWRRARIRRDKEAAAREWRRARGGGAGIAGEGDAAAPWTAARRSPLWSVDQFQRQPAHRPVLAPLRPVEGGAVAPVGGDALRQIGLQPGADPAQPGSAGAERPVENSSMRFTIASISRPCARSCAATPHGTAPSPPPRRAEAPPAPAAAWW